MKNYITVNDSNVIKGNKTVKDVIDRTDHIEVSDLGAFPLGYIYDPDTHTASAPPKPDPVPKRIGIDALADLFRNAAGLTKSDVLGIMQSTNVDIAYVIIGMRNGIRYSRDMQDTQDALDAMVADAYLTSDQRTAVEDNWPTR
jgi:hypothetical protein